MADTHHALVSAYQYGFKCDTRPQIFSEFPTLLPCAPHSSFITLCCLKQNYTGQKKLPFFVDYCRSAFESQCATC